MLILPVAAYQEEAYLSSELELVVIWRLCPARAVLPLPFCRLLEALSHVLANRKYLKKLILGIPALLLHFRILAGKSPVSESLKHILSYRSFSSARAQGYVWAH